MCNPVRDYWHKIEAPVFSPAQDFGKRSDVFQNLVPTAPARIKPSPHALGSKFEAIKIESGKDITPAIQRGW